MVPPFLTLVCRCFFAMLFAVAALGKTYRRSAFSAWRDSLGEFSLVPRRGRGTLAVAVPAVEFLIAVGLVPMRTAAVALLGGALLLLVFASGVAVTLAGGRRPVCRCFGADGGPLTAGRVRWNMVLGLWAGASGLGLLTVGAAAAPGPPELVLAVGVSALAVLLAVHWQDVAFLLHVPGSSAV